MYRQIYNSLKHAGNERKRIAPSADLEFKTDLKREAAHMLDAAKDDFASVTASRDIRDTLAPEFIALLQVQDSYA